MEGHCSTGQSPQWAVVPMEEEEEEDDDDDDDDGEGSFLPTPYEEQIVFLYSNKKIVEVCPSDLPVRLYRAPRCHKVDGHRKDHHVHSPNTKYFGQYVCKIC